MLDEDNGFYYIGNTRVDLTPMEAYTLSYFIENKGKMVLHENLSEFLLGRSSNKALPNVTQVIFRLNKKLKYELTIQALKGVGYKLVYIGKRVL